MVEAPGYESLAEIRAELDRQLEGLNEDQIERICTQAFMAGRSDRILRGIADRLVVVARGDGVNSEAWSKLEARSEVRATYVALTTARMARAIV